jgi:hypothetical protein
MSIRRRTARLGAMIAACWLAIALCAFGIIRHHGLSAESLLTQVALWPFPWITSWVSRLAGAFGGSSHVAFAVAALLVYVLSVLSIALLAAGTVERMRGLRSHRGSNEV